MSTEGVADVRFAVDDPPKIAGRYTDTVPNSKVIMTEYQDVNDRTVVVALHCDETKKHLIVNRIASVYRKDNDYFFLNQIKKGNLEYIDEKRSREWAKRQKLQLPPLVAILGYNPNLTTKEDFVNSQTSISNERRNLALEQTYTQGEKTMEKNDERTLTDPWNRTFTAPG